MFNEPLVEKITVDENEYKTAELPDPIKNIVSLYQEAASEVIKAQRQAAMFEASRRALGDNVIQAVRQWNAQRIKELQAAANAKQEAAPATEEAPATTKKPNARKLKAVTNETPEAVQ